MVGGKSPCDDLESLVFSLFVELIIAVFNEDLEESAKHYGKKVRWLQNDKSISSAFYFQDKYPLKMFTHFVTDIRNQDSFLTSGQADKALLPHTFFFYKLIAQIFQRKKCMFDYDTWIQRFDKYMKKFNWDPYSYAMDESCIEEKFFLKVVN